MSCPTAKFTQLLGCASKNALKGPLILVWFQLIAQVSGGICWLRYDETGNCHGLKTVGVSKQECCSSDQPSHGWTEKDDYSSGRLFYLAYLNDKGMPNCAACHQSCENVECSGVNERCRMRNGVARCTCSPDCSAHSGLERGPLCGLDGQSYRNLCMLLRHNCRRHRHTQVDYYGSRCQYSCDSVQCRDGENCVTDQNGRPHCVPCDPHEQCREQADQKLCGADGVTYASMCHFKKATCLNGGSIGIAYRGECDRSHTCSSVTCEPGLTCLWNNESQTPQCARCGRSCDSRLGANVVCGTDGVTYDSYCQLKERACATGRFVATAHYGACHTSVHSVLHNDYEEMQNDEAYFYSD